MIVGVIGGGQLARMMIPAAVNLGIDIRVLAEQPGMQGRSVAIEQHDIGVQLFTAGQHNAADPALAQPDLLHRLAAVHAHTLQCGGAGQRKPWGC